MNDNAQINSSISREYEFEAVTDVWTGKSYLEFKHNKKEKAWLLQDTTNAEELITTGLLGSIRWWFEVLVRGLGGYACDPNNSECQDAKHCVVCELFGCTGWARKFRFSVLDESGTIKQERIKSKSSEKLKDKKNEENEKFTLRFTPLRNISEEEWNLLEITLRLISDYGAIGGKTVYKPSIQQKREDKEHHKDFGIIQMINTNKYNENSYLHMASSKTLTPEDISNKLEECRKLISSYCKSYPYENKDKKYFWASLKNLWFLKNKYLTRVDDNTCIFNEVIERNQGKRHDRNEDSWLAGKMAIKNKVDTESKKVFSFKSTPRTFGFINPDGSEKDRITFESIKDRLQEIKWEKTQQTKFCDLELITGSQIIDMLFHKR